MRRSERQIESKAEMESIIRDSTICHLALSDDGRPYIVPLNFGYEKGALYFHCAKEGRKIDIIRLNSEACFSFVSDHRIVPSESACGWSTRYRSVTGFGTASLLEDRDSRKAALGIIMNQYSGDEVHFEDGAVDEVMIIRIEIESMTGKASGD